jgi:glycosyltransferase involved in cell wall biosynthesis
MNVLHLDLGREWRGGQRQVVYLARALAREGYGVTVAAPLGSPILLKAADQDLEVAPLPGRREWRPGNVLAVSSLVRERGIDVVHTHDARSAALGAILKLVGPVRFKLVHSRRVSYPLSGWWGVEKYRLADKVVAVSAEIKDVLAACGLDEARLTVIHSGIDLSRYPPKAGHAGGPVIGLVGSLSPQKGVEVFLDALAFLAGRSEDLSWRAVVVGDGRLERELIDRANRLGLAGRVTFTGFRESREVLPGFDLLAVPSVSGEGSSGVIKEAWAVGLPLVVSNLPSNLELAADEDNALVVPVGDAQALARALERLLAEPELCRSLAESGRRRVLDFTDQAMAAAYMRLYRSLFPER